METIDPNLGCKSWSGARFAVQLGIQLDGQFPAVFPLPLVHVMICQKTFDILEA